MECDAHSNQFIDNLLLCRLHVQQYLFTSLIKFHRAIIIKIMCHFIYETDIRRSLLNIECYQILSTSGTLIIS